MAVSDAQLKTLILAELEAVGADLTALGGQMDVLFDIYASKSYVAGRLQYLYVKRHAVQFLIGRHWQDVQHSDAGYSSSDQQLADTLNKLLAQVNQEIADVERLETAGFTPATGQITAVAPIEAADTDYADPNDRAYRGDPLTKTVVVR